MGIETILPPRWFGRLVKPQPLEANDREYTRVGQRERKENAGRHGIVIKQGRGHGLCYEVLFIDGASAWYEPEELGLEDDHGA